MSETLNILNRFGEDRVDAIQLALKENRINASGRLSESVSYETKQKGFVFTLEISAFSYIISALQEGRGPTKKPGKGELRKNIAKWVDDKPVRIPDKLTKAQFINATTNRIHKEGTVLYREYGKLGKTTGELERIFSNEELKAIEEELIEMSLTKVSNSFTKFSTIE